jgi:RNA-directed DNA polymerase
VLPEEYRRALRSLRTLDDLAALLDISPRALRRYSYGIGRRYHQVEVKKRRGGVRIISQPADGLKIIQQKLAQLLAAAYRRRDAVHGFVTGRSIATNAAAHAGRRWVFNLDLTDFFPSINFGRVRGRLISRPYSLPENLATVVAQICCYNNQLPQGAPTSPVLSNMICSKMDAELERLASRHRCRYTRYADDLTFSTNALEFPLELGSFTGSTAEATPGPALTALIASSGFTIHAEKVRLQRFDTRQVVTGLIVNQFPNVTRPYVRRVRAMLRAWRVFGYDAAESEFRRRHDKRYRPFGPPRFRQVVKGHIDFIGMVRGSVDPIYEELLENYASLEAEFRKRPRHRRSRSHLPTFEDALWVIEWDWGLGTGFELEGYGLVTCAHVLHGVDHNDQEREVSVVQAWQPRADTLKIRAKVEWQDETRDLAVLRLDRPSGRPLKLGPSLKQPTETEVWAAGYPNMTPGTGLWRDSGAITRLEHHIGSPRYMVNFPIVSGASGSPVMDMAGRVIGIASMGAESFEEAARRDSIRFGVIPIDLLVEGAPKDVGS